MFQVLQLDCEICEMKKEEMGCHMLWFPYNVTISSLQTLPKHQIILTINAIMNFRKVLYRLRTGVYLMRFMQNKLFRSLSHLYKLYAVESLHNTFDQHFEKRSSKVVLPCTHNFGCGIYHVLLFET